MAADKDLTPIVEQMAGIKSRFANVGQSYSAPHEDEVAFEGLLVEARVLIGDAVGPLSEFRGNCSGSSRAYG